MDIPIVQSGPVYTLISYQKITNSYYIKDNGQGLGTFLKIKKPTELILGHTVAFGESSLAVVAVTPEQIQVKFLDGPRAEESLYFVFEQSKE